MGKDWGETGICGGKIGRDSSEKEFVCLESRRNSRDKVLGTHLGVGLRGVIDHSLGEVPVQKK